MAFALLSRCVEVYRQRPRCKVQSGGRGARAEAKVQSGGRGAALPTEGACPALKQGPGTGAITLALTYYESCARGLMASNRRRTNVWLGPENSHKHLLMSRAEMENFPEGSSVTAD